MEQDDGCCFRGRKRTEDADSVLYVEFILRANARVNLSIGQGEKNFYNCEMGSVLYYRYRNFRRLMLRRGHFIFDIQRQ